MKVMTEWMERPTEGEIDGIKIGLKIRRWKDIEIEEAPSGKIRFVGEIGGAVEQ